jgi:hypothetical protein
MRATLPLAAASIAGIAALAWLPGVFGSFHFDDLPNIVLDPATSDAGALRERLANGFRPLLRLSYAADHALWGFTPAGFLTTNLLIHVATVLTVYALAHRRLRDVRAGAIAALIFALQPAHASVVAWSSGRSTGLATLLLLLALLAHERALDAHGVQLANRVASGNRAGRSWTAVSLFSFALAVAVKETALIFPLLLLLWEQTRMTPPARAECVRRVAPAALLAVVLFISALLLSSRLREILDFSLALGTPWDALATHAAALPLSLSLWARPWALSVEHANAFSPLAQTLGALAIVVLIMTAVALRRRASLVTLALLWPIVALLPTHSVLMRLDPIVEKALYPAWIGPSIALGAGVAAVLARIERTHGTTWAVSTRAAPFALLFSALFTLGSLSAWRAYVWAHPVQLWREATEHAPLSARAWRNRALTELQSRDLAGAKRSIDEALRLDPRSPQAHDLARVLLLLSPDVHSPLTAPRSAGP